MAGTPAKTEEGGRDICAPQENYLQQFCKEKEILRIFK
jgi:hypothetical protein